MGDDDYDYDYSDEDTGASTSPGCRVSVQDLPVRGTAARAYVSVGLVSQADGPDADWCVYVNHSGQSSMARVNGAQVRMGDNYVASPMMACQMGLGAGGGGSSQYYYDTVVREETLVCAYQAAMAQGGGAGGEPTTAPAAGWREITPDEGALIVKHAVPEFHAFMGIQWEALRRAGEGVLVFRAAAAGGAHIAVVLIPCTMQSPNSACKELRTLPPDAYAAHHPLRARQQFINASVAAAAVGKEFVQPIRIN